MNADFVELSLLLIMKDAHRRLTDEQRKRLASLFALGSYLAASDSKKNRFMKTAKLIQADKGENTLTSKCYVEVDERIDDLLEVFHHCRPIKFARVVKRFV